MDLRPFLAVCCCAIAAAASAATPGGAAVGANAESYLAPHATRAPMMAVARAGERIVAAGDFGVVLLSDDAARNWRQARVPTRTTLTALAFIDARHGWAVGHSGVVLGTSDGGATWERLASLGAEVVPFAVHFSDSRRGLVVGAFGYAAVTVDGGRSWKKTQISRGEYADQHLYAVFVGTPGVLWIAAEGGTVFRSSDGGANFEALRLPYKGSIWGGIVLRDGAVLVWGMRGRVLRSSDGGRSWAEIPGATQQALTAGVERADGEVVIVGLGGAVIRSRDGGRSFELRVRTERQSHTALIDTGATLHASTLSGVGTSIEQ